MNKITGSESQNWLSRRISLLGKSSLYLEGNSRISINLKTLSHTRCYFIVTRVSKYDLENIIFQQASYIKTSKTTFNNDQQDVEIISKSQKVFHKRSIISNQDHL